MGLWAASFFFTTSHSERVMQEIPTQMLRLWKRAKRFASPSIRALNSDDLRERRRHLIHRFVGWVGLLGAFGVGMFWGGGYGGLRIQGAAAAPPAGEAASVAAGKRLFVAKGCVACHSADGSRMVGPSAKGLWGSVLKMPDGRSILRDAAYMREQILQPNKVITPGYPPVMPSYQGQFSDTEIRDVLAYLASLGTTAQSKAAPSQERGPHKAPAQQRTANVPTKAVPQDGSDVLKRWKSAEVLAIGKHYYTLNCSFCHGTTGRGDGPAGRAIAYTIRDFSKGDYLYGSSPAMIYQIISEGSPRTGIMPAWKHLPPTARWAMVRYLLSLHKTPTSQPSPTSSPTSKP